jgi:Xaa-Pro aminopeptidase
MFMHRVEEAFESIIATGKNSSLPHATAGKAKVRKGDYLLIDMGVKNKLYHSDLTRTACVGEASSRHREIYEIVQAAQLAALKKIRPGARCRDVDAAARELITEAGYGEEFGHGLGHGVGLEIHEGPTLNPRSEEILREGMVVTVEPGVYVPGFGGVRIEDLVVVSKNGYRNLTTLSKEFRLI